MAKVIALVRASWLVALSYRMNFVFSLASVLTLVVPVYFVAGALQPVMAESIAAEGSQYFAFLLIGMIVYSFLTEAVSSLPGSIRGGIMSGTLEAMLTTPTSVGTLLAGMSGYGFFWTGVRAFVLLVCGWVLGMQLVWSHVLPALLILLLIILAYVPFGLFTAALVLAFRTTSPLPTAVLLVSGLLGGVYYPTHVIPSWIQYVSDWVPLTYGLRALRRTMLEGMPLSSVAGDVAILGGFVLVLLATGSLAFAYALRYARRAGTLAQY